jgi:predicted nucleic acid-binding protein
VARPEVPDTSLLIMRSRDRRGWLAFEDTIASGRFWLSAVAVAELYAGTRSREDALLLDRFVALMTRLERVLTPTADEWRIAGQLLARHVRLRGPIRPRDHLADVLILVAAGRIGGTVLTANVRHFDMWAALATSAGLDVGVRLVER